MATKSRGFTGLVYPDAKNLPKNWKQILADSLEMWLISPLHNPDPVEDLETGAVQVKKPHYHVMLYRGNTVSPKNARELVERYPWIVTPPSDKWFMVGSVRNLARYFLHLDQPEKEQFKGNAYKLLTALNSFPLDLTKELTKADKRKLKQDVISVIRSNNIVEYCELVNFLVDTEEWDLFDFATDHTLLFANYIHSVRHSMKDENIENKAENEQKCIDFGQKCIDINTKINTKICPECGSESVVKNGKVRGQQRFLCNDCGATFATI